MSETNRRHREAANGATVTRRDTACQSLDLRKPFALSVAYLAYGKDTSKSRIGASA